MLKANWTAAQPGDYIDTDKDLETYLGDGRDPKRVGTEWKSKGDVAKGLASAPAWWPANTSPITCTTRRWSR